MMAASQPDIASSIATRIIADSDLQDIARLVCLQKWAEAWTRCQALLPALSATLLYQPAYCKAFWLSYLTIVAHTNRSNPLQEWSSIMDFYGDVGLIDLELVVMGAGIYQTHNELQSAKDLIELWIATQPDSFFEQLPQSSQSMKAYEQLLELYLLHICTGLKDWEAAEEFLDFDEVLTAERKELYRQNLGELRQAVERPAAAAPRPAALACPRSATEAKEPTQNTTGAQARAAARIDGSIEDLRQNQDGEPSNDSWLMQLRQSAAIQMLLGNRRAAAAVFLAVLAAILIPRALRKRRGSEHGWLAVVAAKIGHMVRAALRGVI
ncbi:uncharacterized protein BJ171DRAFT_237346 [Polychytrium aggregatum]|uniref:uncharacterized protein n=1 Tax=Polychytrium aggregatum TaxID=110093 RepID=UPI0022FE6A83|nr:uncharacterized protein BJ171DRAFT_237346 [Polychytrium aggregatum]KAI9208264.1 hypothetical protein BJ171DRAFT_237346 [Polychytrium aggregatum]